MATIKSYTDLEQSRKLAEILPLESADMYIYKNIFFGALSCFNSTTQIGEYIKLTDKESKAYPCWSLTALLGVLPNNERIGTNISRGGWKTDPVEYLPNTWWCEYEDDTHTKDFSVSADNPIDACYEMIMKLHELNLL